MRDPTHHALQQSIEGMRRHGIVPAVSQRLRDESGSVADQLYDRVVDEIEAFSNSANPDVLPQLKQHLVAIVDEVCRLLDGGPAGDFSFVRDYAQRQAQQRFPLEAVLHTYRCSHRTIATWVRDAALSAADQSALVRRVVATAADFAFEFTDVISTVATAEYVDHTRRLAEAESDQRAELLNLLLGGYDEADTRTAQLLKRSGYLEQRRSFCVVAARSVKAEEMENAARAQRMVESIGEALRPAPIRLLIGVRDGVVIAVISATRRLSGWTAPGSLLSDLVFPRLEQVGPAALIGLSDDVPSTAHIRRAATEAQLALDFARVSDRVVRYSQIPFRDMILRHARDSLRTASPGWLRALRLADEKARGSLSATLRAYADANMNALQAAKNLSVHPNTIYSRMQRIADTTGKNALAYHDLTEMLLALDSGDN